MPKLGRTRSESQAATEAFYRELDAIVTAALKQKGFTATYKSLEKGQLPASEMMNVQDGVIEKKPSGGYDAALQTDKGPLLLQGAQRWGHESTDDPQLIPSKTDFSFDITTDSGELTADQLLRQLNEAGANASCSLLCAIELASFDQSQRQVLLPLLWQYILDHRNSNDPNELVGVASAIRKYIAIMPMDRMDELAVLLDTGHRSPLPIDLEIEVAKMIYRNFEVHPPAVADPQPALAQRLWEIVQAYIHPRILLRDKHSAAASLAIEAIVSMRSPLAEQAWQAANASPYRWFAELVSDDLDDLHERWSSNSPDAAVWLRELRSSVMAHV